MKSLRSLLSVVTLFAAISLLGGTALAWNCTDPLASRVDVGSVNPGGTSGDADGQWYKGSDATNPNDYYVCEVPKAKTGGHSTTNTNTNTNQNTQSQQQGQAQGQIATGGTSSSTATGGTATGGTSSASLNNSGNSLAMGGSGGQGGQGGSVKDSGNSTNTVKTTIDPTITATNKMENSGNSSNKNTNTAKGGSANGNGSNNQTSASSNQTQSNSSTNANQSSASNQANGNGSNSNDTVNNIAASKIPVNTAYAPTTLPTSPCLKTYSGGGQGSSFGFSFGGGKVDKNCALLETARSFDSMNERLAGCKVKISSDYAKKAGVTLEDCMATELITPPPVVAPPIPVPTPTPVVVVVPQPAPVLAPVVEQPVRTTSISCEQFDNPCKRNLDDMVLRLKADGGRLSVIATLSANQHLVQQMEQYLTKTGVDSTVTILSNQKYTEVNVTLIN